MGTGFTAAIAPAAALVRATVAQAVEVQQTLGTGITAAIAPAAALAEAAELAAISSVPCNPSSGALFLFWFWQE